MFKDKNNSRVLGGGDEPTSWFRLLVKFGSLVMFAIGLGTMKELNLFVNAKLKSEKKPSACS